VRDALSNFEDAIGGRTALIEAIEMAPLDPRQQNFLRVLADPMRGGDSLSRIAHDAGVTPGAVIEMFRNSSFARAHAVAVGIMARDLPAIVQDVNDKAVDRTVTCPECENDTALVADCTRCKGKGMVFKVADFERQKLAYESAGLLKKGGGGVNVQVNQGVAVGVPGQMFSKFVKASDAPVYDISPADFEVEDA
jgi:hypothetical protein